MSITNKTTEAQGDNTDVPGVAAEDPVAKLKKVLSVVSSETAEDIADVRRTADALSTTWNRLAKHNTQKLAPVTDARAEKLLGGNGSGR